jgi:hypothetical protein
MPTNTPPPAVEWKARSSQLQMQGRQAKNAALNHLDKVGADEKTKAAVKKAGHGVNQELAAARNAGEKRLDHAAAMGFLQQAHRHAVNLHELHTSAGGKSSGALPKAIMRLAQDANAEITFQEKNKQLVQETRAVRLQKNFRGDFRVDPAMLRSRFGVNM